MNINCVDPDILDKECTIVFVDDSLSVEAESTVPWGDFKTRLEQKHGPSTPMAQYQSFMTDMRAIIHFFFKAHDYQDVQHTLDEAYLDALKSAKESFTTLSKNIYNYITQARADLSDEDRESFRQFQRLLLNIVHKIHNHQARLSSSNRVRMIEIRRSINTTLKKINSMFNPKELMKNLNDLFKPYGGSQHAYQMEEYVKITKAIVQNRNVYYNFVKQETDKIWEHVRDVQERKAEFKHVDTEYLNRIMQAITDKYTELFVNSENINEAVQGVLSSIIAHKDSLIATIREIKEEGTSPIKLNKFINDFIKFLRITEFKQGEASQSLSTKVNRLNELLNHLWAKQGDRYKKLYRDIGETKKDDSKLDQINVFKQYDLGFSSYEEMSDRPPSEEEIEAEFEQAKDTFLFSSESILSSFKSKYSNTHRILYNKALMSSPHPAVAKFVNWLNSGDHGIQYLIGRYHFGGGNTDNIVIALVHKDVYEDIQSLGLDIRSAFHVPHMLPVAEQEERDVGEARIKDFYTSFPLDEPSFYELIDGLSEERIKAIEEFSRNFNTNVAVSFKTNLAHRVLRISSSMDNLKSSIKTLTDEKGISEDFNLDKERLSLYQDLGDFVSHVKGPEGKQFHNIPKEDTKKKDKGSSEINDLPLEADLDMYLSKRAYGDTLYSRAFINDMVMSLIGSLKFMVVFSPFKSLAQQITTQIIKTFRVRHSGFSKILASIRSKVTGENRTDSRYVYFDNTLTIIDRQLYLASLKMENLVQEILDMQKLAEKPDTLFKKIPYYIKKFYEGTTTSRYRTYQNNKDSLLKVSFLSDRQSLSNKELEYALTYLSGYVSDIEDAKSRLQKILYSGINQYAIDRARNHKSRSTRQALNFVLGIIGNPNDSSANIITSRGIFGSLNATQVALEDAKIDLTYFYYDYTGQQPTNEEHKAMVEQKKKKLEDDVIEMEAQQADRAFEQEKQPATEEEVQEAEKAQETQEAVSSPEPVISKDVKDWAIKIFDASSISNFPQSRQAKDIIEDFYNTTSHDSDYEHVQRGWQNIISKIKNMFQQSGLVSPEVISNIEKDLREASTKFKTS